VKGHVLSSIENRKEVEELKNEADFFATQVRERVVVEPLDFNAVGMPGSGNN
jgi:hypothetical protein